MVSDPNNQERDSVPQIPRGQTHQQHARFRKPKNPAKPPTNPLQRGMTEYLTKHLSARFYSDHKFSLVDLTSSLPKRFTIYPPLLLLPANAFNSTPQWQDLISALDERELQSLYACIAASFFGHGVTHVAINAPIGRETTAGEANKMRSPTGLLPLYGDFGPLSVTSEGEPNKQLLDSPTKADFEAALWASAVQNSGITQVWAPVYSMFSRGNISEKARILGAGKEKEKFEGLEEDELGQSVEDIAVVDMYAGIGYFVFSYLRRGVGRVWGWEINPWSVEGLRRGCERNGWGIIVVRVDSEGRVEGGMRRLVDGLNDVHRVVAFLGDNSFAADVLGEVKSELERQGKWKSIRHVNLGLLPSSKPSWEGAIRVLDLEAGGWIHVHENVDIESIDAMQASIVGEMKTLHCIHRGVSEAQTKEVACRHVERVKTYAPGVMHCVFDMYMYVATTASIGKTG